MTTGCRAGATGAAPCRLHRAALAGTRKQESRCAGRGSGSGGRGWGSARASGGRDWRRARGSPGPIQTSASHRARRCEDGHKSCRSPKAGTGTLTAPVSATREPANAYQSGMAQSSRPTDNDCSAAAAALTQRSCWWDLCKAATAYLTNRSCCKSARRVQLQQQP